MWLDWLWNGYPEDADPAAPALDYIKSSFCTSNSWRDWISSMQSMNNFVLAAAFIGLGLSVEDKERDTALFQVQILSAALAFLFSGAAMTFLTSAVHVMGSICVALENWSAHKDRREHTFGERKYFWWFWFLGQICTILGLLSLDIAVIALVQSKIGQVDCDSFSQAAISLAFSLLAPIVGITTCIVFFLPNMISLD